MLPVTGNLHRNTGIPFFRALKADQRTSGRIVRLACHALMDVALSSDAA